MISKLTKEELKEYGSNESIREAKFKDKNKDIFAKLAAVRDEKSNVDYQIRQLSENKRSIMHENEVLMILLSASSDNVPAQETKNNSEEKPKKAKSKKEEKKAEEPKTPPEVQKAIEKQPAKIICPDCHEPNPVNNTVCQKCGTSLDIPPAALAENESKWEKHEKASQKCGKCGKETINLHHCTKAGSLCDQCYSETYPSTLFSSKEVLNTEQNRVSEHTKSFLAKKEEPEIKKTNCMGCSQEFETKNGSSFCPDCLGKNNEKHEEAYQERAEVLKEAITPYPESLEEAIEQAKEPEKTVQERFLQYLIDAGIKDTQDFINQKVSNINDDTKLEMYLGKGKTVLDDVIKTYIDSKKVLL